MGVAHRTILKLPEQTVPWRSESFSMLKIVKIESRDLSLLQDPRGLCKPRQSYHLSRADSRNGQDVGWKRSSWLAPTGF